MTAEQAIHLIETYMDIQGLAARKGLPITQALDMAIDLLRAETNKEQAIVNIQPEKQGNTANHLSDLIEAKQYIRELLDIIDTFKSHRCGQIDNACKYCIYFSETLNHALCADSEPFKWKHRKQAEYLLNSE